MVAYMSAKNHRPKFISNANLLWQKTLHLIPHDSFPTCGTSYDESNLIRDKIFSFTYCGKLCTKGNTCNYHTFLLQESEEAYANYDLQTSQVFFKRLLKFTKHTKGWSTTSGRV